ncbi:MAG TPA: hypothetical protein VNK96_07070 [Fimbriimonadales bacterium]|nr:hypothetical protein [Fimbriimonadales bacterium]
MKLIFVMSSLLAGVIIAILLSSMAGHRPSHSNLNSLETMNVFSGFVASKAIHVGLDSTHPSFKLNPKNFSIPQGYEWLKSPPPYDTGGVVLSNEDVFVGIIIPHETRTGDKVSSTLVAFPLKETAAADVFKGLVIKDPQGQSHEVKPGEFISFLATASMTFELLQDNKKVASSVAKLNTKRPPLRQPEFPTDPIVCTSQSAIDVSGPFDGDLSNTTVDKGKVLAENPRGAIIALNNLGNTTGRVKLNISDSGKTGTADLIVTKLSLTGARELHEGQSSEVTVTLRGLEDLTEKEKKSLSNRIYVNYRNDSPQNIKLKESRLTHVVDLSKKSLGDYQFKIGFVALKVGEFRIPVWICAICAGCGVPCQGFQCCSTACAPCGTSWVFFCDDAGVTNCARVGAPPPARCAACAGSACAHIGSSACGHWFCACPWGACGC